MVLFVIELTLISINEVYIYKKIIFYILLWKYGEEEQLEFSGDSDRLAVDPTILPLLDANKQTLPPTPSTMARTEYIETAKTAYETLSPTEGSISATPITEPNTGYLDIKDKKPVPVKGELMNQHVTERGET